MCETTESKKKKKNQNDTLDTLLVFYSLVFLFFFEFGYLLGCGFMGGGVGALEITVIFVLFFFPGVFKEKTYCQMTLVLCLLSLPSAQQL